MPLLARGEEIEVFLVSSTFFFLFFMLLFALFDFSYISNFVLNLFNLFFSVWCGVFISFL